MFSVDADERRCIYLEGTGDTNVKVTGTFSIDSRKSSYRVCADDANKVMKILPGKLVNLSTNLTLFLQRCLSMNTIKNVKKSVPKIFSKAAVDVKTQW